MSEQPSGEIILYQRGDSPAIDVRLDGDTVWLSQQQLADLFQTSRSNVVEHIANIYAEAEYAKFRTQLTGQPSDVEAAYLETVKTVQKKISGKTKP